MANIGVWMDHQSARLVEVTGESIRLSELTSGVERRIHATGGTAVAGKGYMRSTGGVGHRDRRRRQQLERYYHELGAAVAAANKLLLLGPGTAKDEFARHLLKEANARRELRIEPSRALTERQLVAYVKEAFGQRRARVRAAAPRPTPS